MNEVKYLGCMINDKGDPRKEVRKRVSECIATMTKLDCFWKHTNNIVKWKWIAFNAIIKTKLMYGLESAQPNDKVSGSTPKLTKIKKATTAPQWRAASPQIQLSWRPSARDYSRALYTKRRHGRLGPSRAHERKNNDVAVTLGSAENNVARGVVPVLLEADHVLTFKCGNYTRQIVGRILPDTVLYIVGSYLQLHFEILHENW